MLLGKTAARNDPRTLKFAKYLKYATSVTTPPAQFDWTHKTSPGDFTMLANDQYGDCVEAAALHMEQVWTSSSGSRPEVHPTDHDALAAYTAVAGFNPADPRTDSGTDMLQFMNYWRSTGIGRENNRVLAYAQVQPGSWPMVKSAIYLFGGLYIGLQLPLTAQNQSHWFVSDVTPNGPGEAGSWGGHCVPVVAYGTDHLTVVTWGQQMNMSWNFFSRYCDEAYAVIPQQTDWERPGDDKTPVGFDWVSLATDLSIVSA